MLRVLRSHLHAHVVTFDYSGFGDSPGSPSESTLSSDARHMFAWLNERLHPSSTLIIYGQSLGTFAAVDLASNLSTLRPTSKCLLILDAPPASLIEATMSHPVALPFRVVPNMRAFLRFCLNDTLDNTVKIANVRIPTLILHGKNDRFITVDQGRCLYRCAKTAGVDVRLVEFDNCGHNNVNAAPDYLPEVHQFLQRHRQRDIISF
ncbi:Monoacylglycerol lipase ABHD12 [Gracilariopsis chorda]|uniref:Monoacylglycerol lipase ABHD12 n=1 Tax=Gracilariopsis chorda TaxID=448386 RepID=A0A2V3J000_9FLOR|nr:Monoacylglycerol lipase ABHD12 [Gracilariopsis chorda]|eukprot:PXF47257.1 Monoacylglycerol lipase ABHD12 [Gracilariopsis chorda]